DPVGSTALSTRLDLEDLREVIRAYHRYCAKVIALHGGFVARYMGDGILAYFGYPRTHEDNAERAVRAGLTLVGGDAEAGRWMGHGLARPGGYRRRYTMSPRDFAVGSQKDGSAGISETSLPPGHC